MKPGDYARTLRPIRFSETNSGTIPEGTSGFVEDVGAGVYRVNFGVFYGGARWVKESEVQFDGEE